MGGGDNRKPHSARKLITRAIVFLIAGAIMNVAVAWACAIRPLPLNWSITRPLAEHVVEIDEGSFVIGTWIYRRWGELIVHRGFRGPGTKLFASMSDEQYRSLVPSWFWLGSTDMRDAGSESLVTMSGSRFQHEHATGWPLLCMRMTGGRIARGGDIMTAGSIRIPWRRGFSRVNLPASPYIPNFIANSIFYAAILWLLFAAPFAIRKRRRITRGLCPACAYPVGTSDTCTECGAALLKINSRTSTPAP